MKSAGLGLCRRGCGALQDDTAGAAADRQAGPQIRRSHLNSANEILEAVLDIKLAGVEDVRRDHSFRRYQADPAQKSERFFIITMFSFT